VSGRIFVLLLAISVDKIILDLKALGFPFHIASRDLVGSGSLVAWDPGAGTVIFWSLLDLVVMCCPR
jgi:hypothetical protein